MRKILLVEDDDKVREAVYENLSYVYTNTHIDVAIDGYIAKEFIDRNSYELIITDINMPRTNGFGTGADLINYMLTKKDHTPIIVITGHTEISDVYKQYGCLSVLTKPLDFRELQTAIDNAKKFKTNECRMCDIGKSIASAHSIIQDILDHLNEKSHT